MSYIFSILITLFLAENFSESGFSMVKNDPSIEKENENVQIYPNPAKDFIYVSTKNNVQIKRIIVFNIVGNKILDYSPKQSHNRKKQLNVSRLASGKYFVKVLLSDNTQEMKHLIKL